MTNESDEYSYGYFVIWGVVRVGSRATLKGGIRRGRNMSPAVPLGAHGASMRLRISRLVLFRPLSRVSEGVTSGY